LMPRVTFTAEAVVTLKVSVEGIFSSVTSKKLVVLRRFD